jgi:hypothetical protein
MLPRVERKIYTPRESTKLTRFGIKNPPPLLAETHIVLQNGEGLNHGRVACLLPRTSFPGTKQ